MKQNYPFVRLSGKSLVSFSFALRSPYTFLAIKEIPSEPLSISLNPIVGKGPPGPARSPGRGIHVFHKTFFNPNLYTNENQFNPINTKSTINHN